MLQVLLLGFNNLDLNKFIFLQREDKNGCTWHETRGQCVCKCLYVSLCVISGWVWVNERMVGVFCAHVCVRVRSGVVVGPCPGGGLDLPLIGRLLGGSWAPVFDSYQASQPLPRSTARCFGSAGTLTLWPWAPNLGPPLFSCWDGHAKCVASSLLPEINFQVFTALPTYEVCQWCLTVIFTVFSLVGNMPGWSCITTFTYAGTALSPEQLKKAQHGH